jgi:hypothetical protein
VGRDDDGNPPNRVIVIDFAQNGIEPVFLQPIAAGKVAASRIAEGETIPIRNLFVRHTIRVLLGAK